MDEVCYNVVTDALRAGHQVMVFVHSRKGTGTTAKALGERAAMEGELERLFTGGEDGEEGDENEARTRYVDRVEKSRNRELREHFNNGMGIHHAGMLRPDRKLTEQMFNDGAIKVLVSPQSISFYRFTQKLTILFAPVLYCHSRMGHQSSSALGCYQGYRCLHAREGLLS
jgi:replicative superfamily II helicase